MCRKTLYIRIFLNIFRFSFGKGPKDNKGIGHSARDRDHATYSKRGAKNALLHSCLDRLLLYSIEGSKRHLSEEVA